MKVAILNASDEEDFLAVNVSEKSINKKIKLIENYNYSVKNIVYIKSNKGYLQTVIIEYDD